MGKPFMDKDFLLSGDTARKLYHDHAAQMPIIDYHCHIDPREIYEDKVFNDLTEVWLGGDHYKWRAMRSNGVAEEYITGQSSTPYEKFERWAATMPKMIGNPLYHWTHLELQRYFGIHEPLTPDTCRAIWDKGNEQLKGMSARSIIARSGVKAICTTDDPADDLRWHKLIAQDASFACRVLPAFRPDKALNIDKPGFKEYLARLGEAAGLSIDSLSGLKEALRQRLDYFVSLGCPASDHGLDYMMFEQGDADAILRKVLRGEAFSRVEADAFKTEVMTYLAGLYRERGVVMQLHYGAVRNNNPSAMAALGPDTGFDAIWGAPDSGAKLGALLGHMEQGGGLPKTIIYSLNPGDNAQIGSIIGCFQRPEHPGWVQHGSAWWFNDTKTGMIEQITSLANFSVLGNFIGMLTDSRSFLSYTRHEYFRRILCELIGTWVDNGEYPRDMALLGRMVEDISYNNTAAYFGLSQEVIHGAS